jgi:hypothetical protein
MTNTDTITADIQTTINGRALPFPIHAAKGSGEFITLSIHVRDNRGNESAESASFPVPSDPVLLNGLNAPLERMITRGNLAQHMGMEVF